MGLHLRSRLKGSMTFRKNVGWVDPKKGEETRTYLVEADGRSA